MNVVAFLLRSKAFDSSDGRWASKSQMIGGEMTIVNKEMTKHCEEISRKVKDREFHLALHIVGVRKQGFPGSTEKTTKVVMKLLKTLGHIQGMYCMMRSKNLWIFRLFKFYRFHFKKVFSEKVKKILNVSLTFWLVLNKGLIKNSGGIFWEIIMNF